MLICNISKLPEHPDYPYRLGLSWENPYQLPGQPVSGITYKVLGFDY